MLYSCILIKLDLSLYTDFCRGVGEGGGARGSSGNDTSVGEKLLSTLLTEIDGLELAQGVLVLAATNRPQAIDAALMRPGRFDSVLYVPPPDFESRLEVLHVHTRHMQLSDDVDLEEVAENTECFTGAELAGLCREAAIAALRESLEADTVCKRHFSSARNGIQPTLTPLQIASYANFRTKRLT
jgi:SpoVK/Ycf46/Vps4 family AAA+-type ATPase